ncbi:MAG: hypothetical protein ACYC0V_12845 [Armatimonadota bacterium]
MKITFPILVLTAAMCCGVHAADRVKGVIGDTDLSFRVKTIQEGKSLQLPIDMHDAKLVRIREVYPDTPKQPRYTYDVFIDGKLVLKRDNQGTGFGPVSFFIQVPEWARESDRITIVNKCGEQIRVMDAQIVTGESLSQIESTDSFGLLGMAPWSHGSKQAKAWIDDLALKIPVKPGFYRGYSTEFYFARWTKEAIEQQMVDSLKWAKEKDMVFLPLMVSWWSGTPLEIPDGEGGKFGDTKYQQVCWSPEHTVDDIPQLKALLGDRWDVHYCLSIPNEWSNVPWLTMNSPKLNAYRHERLDEALRMFSEKLKSTDVPILGVCLDNEPRYWDTACEAGNPKRDLTTVWGDFNPLVIADAAKEDVNLNPADALDAKERMWLHRNVARYNQNTVNQTVKTLKKVNPALLDRVYTHSLQLVGFPGDEIGHAMSEWAYAKGALTGIEGFWMKLSDLDRIREWGPWANINREETDGADIGMHIWDLRLTYARGGRLYNSYNWYGVGFDYVRDFLDTVPSAKVADPMIERTPSGSITFGTNLGIQGINRIMAKVDLPEATDSALLVEVTCPTGKVLGFARAEGPFHAGLNSVAFTFANPVGLLGDTLGFLVRGTLTVSYEKTGMTKNPVINDADFWFDLRRERTQSLWVIANSR